MCARYAPHSRKSLQRFVFRIPMGGPRQRFSGTHWINSLGSTQIASHQRQRVMSDLSQLSFIDEKLVGRLFYCFLFLVARNILWRRKHWLFGDHLVARAASSAIICKPPDWRGFFFVSGSPPCQVFSAELKLAAHVRWSLAWALIIPMTPRRGSLLATLRRPPRAWSRSPHPWALRTASRPPRPYEFTTAKSSPFSGASHGRKVSTGTQSSCPPPLRSPRLSGTLRSNRRKVVVASAIAKVAVLSILQLRARISSIICEPTCSVILFDDLEQDSEELFLEEDTDRRRFITAACSR